MVSNKMSAVTMQMMKANFEGDRVCQEINQLMATSLTRDVLSSPHTPAKEIQSLQNHAPDLLGVISTYQGRKRKNVVDDKRMKRIMANRRSARESRERRKVLQEKLEESVSKLSSDHAKLHRENEQLRKQIKEMIEAKKEEEDIGSLPGTSYLEERHQKEETVVSQGVEASASINSLDPLPDHQGSATRQPKQPLHLGLQPMQNLDLNGLLSLRAVQRSWVAEAAPQQWLQSDIQSLLHSNKHQILAALAATRPPALHIPDLTVGHNSPYRNFSFHC
uniref:BZIP domain-containing protein n=1 Tax=Trieres chinensis TaxID=1514140 RepID=A0A7S2EVR9_TRICV|mmetsp:Transcript_5987/g.12501  ORF Transcript_5987/g.12501 Transcript_5987/m.12501 type:complete len:277 (-) Transcript_5987:140-970(-)